MITKNIGWIGTGSYGKHMANHLIKQGYQLSVFSETRSKADDLVAAGATFKPAKSVAKDADVLFLMHGNTRETQDMLIGS